MELSKDCFIAMNDCNHILLMGFGPLAPEDIPKTDVKEAVKAAIGTGFRQIDSAFIYENEAEIGEAIREKIEDGTIKREDIFYTGKLWSTFHPPDLVRPALEKSLKALQLDYIDLYLIQMPISLKPGEDLKPVDEHGKWVLHDVDLRETWQAMEECKEAGLVKSIGVSNFNKKQLELILNKPGLKFEPAVNQVECHVYLNQEKLLDFCNSKDIVLVAYCVFGSAKSATVDKGPQDANETTQDHSAHHQEDANTAKNRPQDANETTQDHSAHHQEDVNTAKNSTDKTKSSVLLEDPVLVKIGEKYKKSPAQVSIRYQLQRGIVVLSASANPADIKKNFEVYDFCLDADDMEALDCLNKNVRYADLKLGEDHPQYPFKDEV